MIPQILQRFFISAHVYFTNHFYNKVHRMKKEKKLLIKAYPNVGEFGNCLRVSIGEKKYMEQFMNALLELDQ